MEDDESHHHHHHSSGNNNTNNNNNNNSDKKKEKKKRKHEHNKDESSKHSKKKANKDKSRSSPSTLAANVLEPPNTITATSTTNSSNSATPQQRRSNRTNTTTTTTTTNAPPPPRLVVPIRVATSSSSSSSSTENPILVSFPAGLPQGLLLEQQQQQQQQQQQGDSGPIFSWRQEASSSSRPAAAAKKSKNKTLPSSHRFRLVGKDTTCLYQSEITVESTTTVTTQPNNVPASSSSSLFTTTTTTTPSSNTTPAHYSQWCVGLYDKRRQLLTLYPTSPNGQVLTLQQSVPTYQPSTTTAACGMAANYATAMERRRLLTQDFGSSKQKKAMQSQQDNLVNVDTVVGGARLLQQIMPSTNDGEEVEVGRNSSMSESNRRAIQEQRHLHAATADGTNAIQTVTDPVEEGYEQVRRQYLPRRYDKDAKEPIWVYHAKDMLEEDDEAWSHIVRVVDACRKQTNVMAALTQPPPPPRKNDNDDGETESKKPQKAGAPWNASVVAALQRLLRTTASAHDDEDDHLSKYQLQCALLLNHMINFYRRNAQRKFIRAPTEEHRTYWWECHMPQVLVRRFLTTFCILRDNDDDSRNVSYVMSPQKRDKCILHMVLLYMIVQGGRSMKVTNLQPIVKDLQVDVAVATKLLRLAGCTIVQQQQQSGKQQQSMAVELKVPLTFPAPAQRKRRRKT